MSHNKFYIKVLEKPWENPEVVHDFGDGRTVVRVQTPWDYCLESWFLDHCLCSKHFETFEVGHRVFSVRDRWGIPHATILCLLPGVTSPYSGCADLHTVDYYRIGGENLRILQVRGREDRLAQTADIQAIGEWLGIDLSRELGLGAAVFGDNDSDYHLRHLLPYNHLWENWTPASKKPINGSIERGWLSY